MATGRISAEFGEFLRKKRIERGITLTELATTIGITPAYLCDIEKANRPAPTNRLKQMSEKLGLLGEDKDIFFDLAAETMGNYEDLNSYLGEVKEARIALRRARDTGFTPDDWRRFTDYVEKKKGDIHD